ncbi:MAG: TM2 domain-containing protein [Ignavibacteria bacterium]|jgi:TM2 domain-containing membrane protein YozV|nr:TM2 domain-containing protein [Ignavibacteria bacterium]
MGQLGNRLSKDIKFEVNQRIRAHKRDSQSNSVSTVTMQMPFERKSKWVAAALAYFGGTWGLQKFYIGSKGAWKHPVFCWTCVPTLIGIVDCIRFVFMSQQEFDIYCIKKQGYVINEEINFVNINMPAPQARLITPILHSGMMQLSFHIGTVTKSLQKDKNLLQHLDNNPQNVAECICYDMSQIYLAMYKGEMARYEMEAFVTTLLLPNENSDLINRGIDQLEEMLGDAKYKEFISGNVLMYMKMDNPLSMVSGSMSSLSLPSLLKRERSVHFEEYGEMLDRFAKFLSTVDGMATADEQGALKGIYPLIYSPSVV